MTGYLSLVPKYLAAHRRSTRLVVISVAISVALVTTALSMFDASLQFEKIQVMHDVGNYHLTLKDATAAEMRAIAGRRDVRNCGRWVPLEDGRLGGSTVALAAVDQRFAHNLNITVTAGDYPTAANEMMLEQWAVERLRLSVGDTATISLADGTAKPFVVSGIYSDLGNTKASGTPGVLLAIAAAEECGAANLYLIEFRDGVQVPAAEEALKRDLRLAPDRVGRNERLLAVMGQSTNSAVVGVYATGAILFAIVLAAGVMMIYNTLNISVLDRVRQFGLLRCLGATQSQIRRLLTREGLHFTLRAVPIGVLAGILMTSVCLALLRFYNSSLFGDIPLVRISTGGIGAGLAVGGLTVFLASFLPARRAARVSPVNAVTGSDAGESPRRQKKRGFMTRLFPIETAMGIGNAVSRRRTLFLMTASIALSIVMFLGFQVFIDFLHTSMRTTKPYTPDITLVSEQGISGGLYGRLSDLAGTRRVYGRMFDYVAATFDAARLTDAYRQSVGGVTTRDDGRFDPPEESWLISYDRNQLAWAKADLLKGELSEEALNEQDGVVAVAMHLRNNIVTETADLQLGDRVSIETPRGTREMTVVGILRSVPFGSSRLALTTFITTEKLFSELTGKSSYDAVDIQLNGRGQEQTVKAVKGLLPGSVSIRDARQKNAEADQAFFTMAVFIYGFVVVIGLISVLNIINTMNTSVAAKTRYLGLMRAVGMAGAQLDRMVLVEAATYSLTGGILGCLAGMALQKALIDNLLSQFHITWEFPAAQLGLILIIILAVTAISVVGPLQRVTAQSVTKVIGSL